MASSSLQIDFAGKTVLVTGATRGIGKQIADDLLQLNATLMLTGTNAADIEKLNKEAKAANQSISYYYVDFSSKESTQAFIEKIGAIKIDCLVNNAGINRLNSIDDVLAEDWDDMIAVNLSAPMYLIRTVVVKMKEQQYGRIVNVASIFSKISKERRSVYSATKFGLHGLTVGISNDVARYNVMVNTISPGFIITELTKKNLSEAERDEMAKIIPAKRLGQASDISRVVTFLLSNLNTYLTGQNIVVDGGFTNV
jgi:3-oxoacyl-[acyl-carrier protein] reductase